MKKLAALFSTLMLTIVQINLNGQCCPPELNVDIDFGLETGFRSDRISINSYVPISPLTGFLPGTALVSTNTNEKWRQLDMWTVGGYFRLTTYQGFYLRGSGEWGNVFEGRDDFSSNSAALVAGDVAGSIGSLFSQTNYAGRSRGNVYDAEVAVGYSFRFLCERLAIEPIVGWAYDYIKLKDRTFTGSANLEIGLPADSISELAPPYLAVFGTITGKSSQKFQTAGPFLGFDLSYQLDCYWKIIAGYEYHWGRLHADFVRNTATTFSTFLPIPPTTLPIPLIPAIGATPLRISERARCIEGQEGTLGFLYTFIDDCYLNGLTVGVTANYKRWKLHHHGKINETGILVPAVTLVADDLLDLGIVSPLGAIANSGKLSSFRWSTWKVSIDLGLRF